MGITRRPGTMLAVVALGALSSLSIVCAKDAASLDAPSLFAGWKAHYGGIQQMRFRLSKRLVDVNENGAHSLGPQNAIKFKSGELTIDSKTKRFHLRYCREEGGLDKSSNIYESAFDGKTTKEYWGNGPRKRGGISSGPRGNNPAAFESDLRTCLLAHDMDVMRNGQREQVAFMDFVDGTFARRIGNPKVDVEVKPTLDTVAGEPCHVLESGLDGKVLYRIWFAHGKGMLPMKHQLYSWNGDLLSEVVVLEAAKVETDTSVTWYPSKLTQTTHVLDRDESGTVVHEKTVTCQIEVPSFTPNVEIDESTFQFEFPIGTQVHDAVRGTDYMVREWREKKG